MDLPQHDEHSASSSSGPSLDHAVDGTVPGGAGENQKGSMKDGASDDESSSTGRNPARRRPEMKELAADDTRMVKRSKIVVYLVLVIAAVVVGTLTYILTKNSQEETFESEVRLLCKKD